MINCFNNKLLNTFTLYFDIHNRNWRMCMEYINMLTVMTGKHALLYRTIWIYCFHFPRKIYKYFTLNKKNYYTSIFFVLKKKFKIVKIHLKNTFKARYLRGSFQMILARISFKSFLIWNLLWQHVWDTEKKDIVYNVSKYFVQHASVPPTTPVNAYVQKTVDASP